MRHSGRRTEESIDLDLHVGDPAELDRELALDLFEEGYRLVRGHHAPDTVAQAGAHPMCSFAHPPPAGAILEVAGGRHLSAPRDDRRIGYGTSATPCGIAEMDHMRHISRGLMGRRVLAGRDEKQDHAIKDYLVDGLA